MTWHKRHITKFLQQMVVRPFMAEGGNGSSLKKKVQESGCLRLNQFFAKAVIISLH